LGEGESCAIMSAEVGASAPEDFDQRNLARVKKLRRVSLLLPLTVGVDRVRMPRAK
jgi:hypothetical protein